MRTAMDFRKRQRVKRALFSRVTIVLLALVAVVLARGVWGIYQKERDTASKLEQAQEEESELAARETFLKSNITRLGTPQGVESEIRENFGLGKPGERVIIVVPGDATAAANGGGVGNFWDRVKHFFTSTRSYGSEE